MNTKVCRKCNQEKPKTEFHFSNREKGYLSYICKPCSRIATREFYHSHAPTRLKVAARAKAWNKANPHKLKGIRRKAELKAKFGLTEADYDRILAEQGAACAICRSTDNGRKAAKWADGRFHVDHCHETGRVRSLLCHGCNVRLGGFERLLKDRPIDWLLAYIRGPADDQQSLSG